MSQPRDCKKKEDCRLGFANINFVGFRAGGELKKETSAPGFGF
jgi:hypothetical protein